MVCKLLLAILVVLPSPRPQAAAQDRAESYRIGRPHPRLFLEPRRLRLLQRERQRLSLRWQQFELVMKTGGALPEPGFALALYSQVTDDPKPCRQAAEWATQQVRDTRQTALVFDWCQSALTPSQSGTLSRRLRSVLEGTSREDPSISAVRDRVLAAIALSGHVPSLPEQKLRFAVEVWWREQVVPGLRSGRASVPQAELYPLAELLHAVRDNLFVDLREAAGLWFRDLPKYLLLSFYPAPFPAAENEYWIPAWKGEGEVNLEVAALTRAAALATVAYDPNLLENQFLQGWLIHDRFLMRGSFGIPYEFLWANPYLPGLSYYHVPLAWHDTTFGRLFLRSSWEEDAVWLGYFDRELQLFEKGERKILRPEAEPQPICIQDAAVLYTSGAARFTLDNPETKLVFVVGLAPGGRYEIEADDEEMRELEADRGGILEFTVTPRPPLTVRVRPAVRQ
ncbi:MAG: hypothetical protein RMK57_14855 [Bryobacterales bacterium]|nr:hypothetical protein [Bryobacteraceae bacterium]MDW8355801.1 hypothetical protein [Bryobacterales bacterium]